MDPNAVRSRALKRLMRPLQFTRVGMIAERLARCFWPVWTLVFVLIAAIAFGAHDSLPVEGVWIAGGIWLAAFVVALSGSFASGIYVLLFFVVVQQVENNVLIPFIMGKTLKVHPVVVLISVLAGARVAGLFGVLVSVPVAVLAQEIFNYLAEQKTKKPQRLV